MKYIFLFLFVVFGEGEGTFNLFLSQEEVKQLLGLENELFYVRDGLVNEYAIGFVIPIPSQVDRLHFTWSLSSPLLQNLNYALSASSSHPLALAKPKLNISSTGVVPTKAEVWEASIPCTGLEDAEVVITIDLDLKGLDLTHAGNLTSLRFRRKKVCEKSQGTSGVEGGTALLPLEDSQPERVPAYVIFFGAVGGSLLFIIIVITIAMVTWMKGTKGKKQYHAVHVSASLEDQEKNNVTRQTADSANNSSTQSYHHNNSSTQSYHHHNSTAHASSHIPLLTPRLGAYGVEQEPRYRESPPGVGAASFPPDQAFPPGHSDAETTREKARPGTVVPIEEIAVDRLALTLGDLLHEGTFGRVYQGRLEVDCDSDDVMVKTVVMGSSINQIQTLVEEGSRLHGIGQKHVLTLVATTYDGSSPMMIYPYCAPGNLKRWLSSCHHPVSTHQAVCLGLQLLTALKHLHKRKIIHRDVAARNCYLSGSSCVKLCDPALSRDLFPNDYHCLGHNENRPVKWMAVESISCDKYSSASDVWAWAVTVWEILTRAQQPFPDVDPFEMEAYLMEGFRLHQPVNCPDQLYSVMASCWAHSPHHRTTVQNLYSHLANFSSQLQEFV